MKIDERQALINAEYLDEVQEDRVHSFDETSDNLVIQHVFELKDHISYGILKQELIDTLERDKYPLLLDGDINNVVRIMSENIENLPLEDVNDKYFLSAVKEEIRTIVLDHLKDTYDITYNINENESFIDLEKIADLYEFFVIRKLDNIYKFYYSIISMTFFDKLIEKEEDREELILALKQYLVRLSPKLTLENFDELTTNKITMDLLTNFFNNKSMIINSGISNIEGMSSFLNFLTTINDGEVVSDSIREMFYNFGGYEGIEFDDSGTFRKYFDCIEELENSNDLLVMLSTKVFDDFGI